MRVRSLLTAFGVAVLLSGASLAAMLGVVYVATVPDWNPALRLEAKVDVLPRFSTGDSAAVLTVCQTFGFLPFMGRPEISAGTSEVFYSLRGGGVPGAPCGVVSQRFVPSTLAPVGTDAPLLLDAILPCHWQDTRLSDGGEFVSSSMTETFGGSCNPGQGFYRLVPLAPTGDRLARDPFRSVVVLRSDDGGCPSYAGKPLLWFNDDSATAVIGGVGYAVTACGNPGVASAPRLFRILRAAGTATQSIMVDASGGPEGLARPRWVGHHQVALVPTDGTSAILIYAGDPRDGTGPRLAWAVLDLDPATCPGLCILDSGGWLGGSHRSAEKYPLGAIVRGGKLVLAYLYADQLELWESCSNGEHQCLPGDAGALSIRVLDVAALESPPTIPELDVEFVNTPSLVDTTLRTAAMHPDLAWSGDSLLLTYALMHYPGVGCGSQGLEPCRWRAPNPKPGEDDVKLLSVRLAKLTLPF